MFQRPHFLERGVAVCLGKIRKFLNFLIHRFGLGEHGRVLGPEQRDK